MKYIVMESHKGYAVLMDEDSHFVRAANLHYTVGQTVTSPFILEEDKKRPLIKHSVFVKIAAAAACLMLISAAGLNYYSKNFKTRSVLTIGSDFYIQLELNSKGKVIRMNSATADGQNVLDHCTSKDKNMVGTVNDILAVMQEQGYITEEDTVELYISADSRKDSASYKDEIEHEVSGPKLNVSVVDKHGPKLPEPPVPTEKTTEKVKPAPTPPHENTSQTPLTEPTKPTPPVPDSEAAAPKPPAVENKTEPAPVVKPETPEPPAPPAPDKSEKTENEIPPIHPHHPSSEKKLPHLKK